MFYRIMATCFENIEKTYEIRLKVGARVLDGLANTSLSREIHNHIEAMLGKQALDRHAVG